MTCTGNTKNRAMLRYLPCMCMGMLTLARQVICGCYPQTVSNKDAVFNVPFTGFQWLKSSCISLSTFESTAVPKILHVNNKYMQNCCTKPVCRYKISWRTSFPSMHGSPAQKLSHCKIELFFNPHACGGYPSCRQAEETVVICIYMNLHACMHANCKNYFVRTGKVIAVSGFIEQAIEEIKTQLPSIKPSQPIELAETLVC